MDTVLTIVRLRWALTWAALRKSVWQTIGYVISLLMGVAVVVGTGVLAWFLGDPAGVNNASGFAQGLEVIVVLLGAFITLMTAFAQLMLIGESSTMSPRKLELYGIPDRTLQAGLLAAGLSGIPAICAIIALMLWSLAYRWMGIGVVVAAIIAAPLTVITVVSFSKMVINAATTLVRSNRGKNLFYIIVTLAFVAICYVPSITLNSSMEGISFSIETFAAPAAVFAWTPFGAAFQLPFDVLHGAWGPLIGRLAVLALSWVLCFMASTWCLRHERLVSGSQSEAVSVKGIGAFSWMPDSVSGAVSARLFTYLKRDPRQGLMFAFPVIFLVLMAFQSHGITPVVWTALPMSAMFFSITESNGLAYDGRGLTMQVISGVSGMADRLGRVRIYVGVILTYLVALTIACFVVTGDWRTPDGILMGVTFAAGATCLAFCGLGLAEVVSCVLMYPVPSMEKPFATPQGRAVAQGFFPLVYLLGMFMLAVPSGLVAVVLAVAGQWDMYWVLIPVFLLNGAGFLALGSWLGGKLMDARMLSIVSTLDSFASLQK